MRNTACVVLASSCLLFAVGCSADISTGARPGSTPSPFDPGPAGSGTDPNGGGDPNGGSDPSGGMNCPPGEHWGGQACIADEVTCAAEFPCPDNQQCVGGRCISARG